MKKLSNNFPLVLTIISIIFCLAVWDLLKFPYDNKNLIQGVPFEKKINPYDNILKVFFFVFFPLSIYLFSFLQKKNSLSLNPYNNNFFLTYNKNLKSNEIITDFKKEYYVNAYSLLLIILCILEFFSLNFDNLLIPIDIYHDGQTLVPSFNFLNNKNFWLSTHFDWGIGGNLRPLIIWNILEKETIGALRIFDQFLILFNKIFIILICVKTTKILKIPENQELFFLILALSSLQLTDYFVSLHGTAGPPFPIRMSFFLLFFLILTDNIIRDNLLKNISLGFFSSISLLWYTDIAIYLNFVLVTYLVILIFLKNFNKIFQITIGIIFSWFGFFFYFGFEQINELFYQINANLSFIYYFNFIEFPKPFSENYNSSRALKSLILIIINGIFLINLCLKKKLQLKTFEKTYLIMIFICSIVIFKSALIRSDNAHLKYTSGFILFLFIIQLYYCLFRQKLFIFFIKKINFYKKETNILIFTIISLIYIYIKDININKIYNNLNYNLSSIISKDDNYFLNFQPGTFSYGKFYSIKNYDDDLNFIEFYKKISEGDKCVQNFTEYLSLSYFLKKPTCTRFYNTQFIQHKITDEKFLNEFKNKMPEYILYSSPIIFINKDGVREQDDLIKGIPRVDDFIKKNYSFFKSYLNQWIVYKKKS